VLSKWKRNRAKHYTLLYQFYFIIHILYILGLLHILGTLGKTLILRANDEN